MAQVSEIFDPRPAQWGFRGDPFLWAELQEHFAAKELPYPKAQFTSDFYELFETLTGDSLSSKRSTFVSRYGAAASGMSRGQVSHMFWKDKGFPLLLSRLEQMNADCAK